MEKLKAHETFEAVLVSVETAIATYDSIGSDDEANTVAMFIDVKDKKHAANQQAWQLD